MERAGFGIPKESILHRDVRYASTAPKSKSRLSHVNKAAMTAEHGGIYRCHFSSWFGSRLEEHVVIPTDHVPIHAEKNAADEKSEFQHSDAALDEALKQTFPASDPIAVSISQVNDEQAHSTSKNAAKTGK